ncbi:hypothetical protein G3545_04540 [Starkeya sp. ORNL1]|uniref:hypothetical protein n=1 Tax=Starkeya sp. ORNL1 TaxID=2709380 RepID=UPI001462B21D|nr:hypothetical protein [Starkeya sp. ORNL1]QJP12987.1 hypothetical protein G3545_04540 [Starkeya sp. ORNL1]
MSDRLVSGHRVPALLDSEGRAYGAELALQIIARHGRDIAARADAAEIVLEAGRKIRATGRSQKAVGMPAGAVKLWQLAAFTELQRRLTG